MFFDLQEQLSDVLVDDKGSSEVHCQSRFPGGVSNIPGLLNRSLNLHSPNKVVDSKWLTSYLSELLAMFMGTF